MGTLTCIRRANISESGHGECAGLANPFANDTKTTKSPARERGIFECRRGDLNFRVRFGTQRSWTVTNETLRQLALAEVLGSTGDHTGKPSAISNPLARRHRILYRGPREGPLRFASFTFSTKLPSRLRMWASQNVLRHQIARTSNTSI